MKTNQPIWLRGCFKRGILPSYLKPLRILWVCFFLGWGGSFVLGAQVPGSIVIDPGHGGSDLGSVFDDGRVRLEEKDITLKLAILTTRELRLRGYLVTLTRSADFEMSLGQRTQLANRVKADLFLSIHLNSTLTPMISGNEGAEGVETYLLDNATNATSQKLAEMENHGENLNVNPDQKISNKDVALILRDLKLAANQAESKRLACLLQKEVVRSTGFKRDRGVKQALFYVLLGAEMPSALLEAGFVTHRKDRMLLTTLAGRKKVARAIANALDRFILQKGTKEARRMMTSCKVN